MSDGHEAGGTGAPRGATGGRPRRAEKTPDARLEAELAAAQRQIADLEQHQARVATLTAVTVATSSVTKYGTRSAS